MNIILATIMLVLFTALSMLGIYFLYQLLTNFQPGRGKIKADLNKMKAALAPQIQELVPWDKEEMELLSLNQVNRQVRKGMTRTVRGVFTSIYHEPVIAYMYKKYINSGKDENALLYVRTSAHEFIYRIKPKETELTINGQLIGNIKEDTLLYSARSKRLLGRINRSDNELMLPIIVQDEEMGSLIRPEKARQTNPRAFEFLKDMDKDEEAIYLSLAALEMVRRTNELGKKG
jgi:hypothetical protein